MALDRPKRLLGVIAIGLYAHAVVAGEWTLRLGGLSLEGISVDQRVAGDVYHLGLASETAWITLSFPAENGQRPRTARASQVDLNAFEPDIRCQQAGEGGVQLDGYFLRGEVVCTRPAGRHDLDGRFRD